MNRLEELQAVAEEYDAALTKLCAARKGDSVQLQRSLERAWTEGRAVARTVAASIQREERDNG